MIKLHQISQEIQEYKQKQKELYQEEQKLIEEEPEYFTEKQGNSDNMDFTELLPEEYGYSGNSEFINPDLLEKENNEMHDDAEYPEFPQIEEDKDYDYSEFSVITQEETAVTETDDEEEYSGEEYEEFYGEYFPKKRDKRDAGELMEGLLESGEKLLSGNMVGSITTFLKTLSKPVFHYFIKSDNDKAMTKFTHRLLPETGFKGSLNALVISKAAQQVDGERVWSTIAENLQTWNPRSNFKNDKFHKNNIHL